MMARVPGVAADNWICVFLKEQLRVWISRGSWCQCAWAAGLASVGGDKKPDPSDLLSDSVTVTVPKGGGPLLGTLVPRGARGNTTCSFTPDMFSQYPLRECPLFWKTSLRPLLGDTYGPTECFPFCQGSRGAQPHCRLCPRAGPPSQVLISPPPPPDCLTLGSLSCLKIGTAMILGSRQLSAALSSPPARSSQSSPVNQCFSCLPL